MTLEYLHLVLVDSCKNFVAVKSSYKEAETIAKEKSDAVTIYKLVPIAKVKSERRVSKVKVVKPKSKKVIKKK